jgi:hypothetical protein
MNRNRTRLRRAAPLAGAAAVLLTASACGGDDDTTDTTNTTETTSSSSTADDGAAALAEAASTTLGETSMSFELAYAIEGPDVQQEGELEGTGDFSTGSAEVVATQEGIELRSVFDGDDFWLTSSGQAFGAALPDGKQWVHGNLADVADSEVLSRLEPLAILYLLNGAQDVTASADGDSTRYEFTVDMTVAADSAPSDRRQEVEALIDTGDVEPTVSGEAVVDSDNRVTELSFTGNDGAEPPVDISWDASLDGFGEEVTIEPPPDAEVVALDDVPEIRNQLVGP